MSVDALRGFDMFWIIGADALVNALGRIADGLHGNLSENQGSPLYRFVKFLADQLEHAEWEGFHFYDLIFPLFVFIVGVSIVFSLTKNMEQGGRSAAVKRVLRRGILLFIVALFYSGGFSHPWPDIRLMGVLNRIALAYTFAGLLFIFLKPRALVAVCAGLLVGYWALMTFVPVRNIALTRANIARIAEDAGDKKIADYYRNEDSPNPSTIKGSPYWAAAEKYFYATTNYVTGKFDKGHNLADHADFQYLPGRRYDTFFDPEGFLSTLPGIATCLLGVFAGLLLTSQTISDRQKFSLLLMAGIIGIVLGRLWGVQFPVIKKIWTSSYVLVAGGYSCIFLAVFHQVIEIWKYQKWAMPFVWIGMNPITIYLLHNIVDLPKLASRFVGGPIAAGFGNYGELLVTIVVLGMSFLLCNFLYRRKIFLRL